MTSAIPSDLRAAVERRAGASIVAERPRGGGGASRQGAEITLAYPSGERQDCYLAWDTRTHDAKRMAFFERETAALAALSGPLAQSGVRVARLIAAEPSHLALCCAFVPGRDRFPEAPDKTALAADFLDQLARLHAIDASHPALVALGDSHQPVAATIAARLRQLSADNFASGADPLLELALTWLAANVPEDRDKPVLVHGDAGPGNFLYEGDRVTALIDWELTHLGDPMEDLAQIQVRSLIQPFVPMREAFAAYEKASRRPVEVARVKYHRLYFQLGFMVAGQVTQAAAGGPAGAATGAAMLYGTMHRRIVVESLAELSGIALEDPVLPECPAQWTDAGFEVALADLKDEIVPGLTSQRASAKAKALARMVKFWRMRERYGAAFDAQECAEIGAVLGASFAEVPAARAALGQATAAGKVAFAEALRLCHARTTRETFLMRDALGALATTRYEDIA
ncbi:MAG: phosphotransferase family protein [Novosphingobium sp.]|nr:phosphotransferase family protein [Novosphingobium sp.]